MPRILTNSEARTVERTKIRPNGLWDINYDNYERAKRELAIQGRVIIKRVGADWTYGTHRVDRFGQHVICLKTSDDAEEAGKTLWHELEHCVQAEQMAHDPTMMTFTQAKKKYGYRNSPYEIAARAAEAKHYTMPLTKEVAA